ncbi:hypothetical protein DPX16_14079 [Anabarilius grahami]|uniref:Uncharacterized protein n=1 Tax=Anabarilius grahami TaxID=495550 RepID=A0A3N0Y8W9_ANAGA|nr:hypothetical protein DPX16_14079 [Anabarilius grahami]
MWVYGFAYVCSHVCTTVDGRRPAQGPDRIRATANQTSSTTDVHGGRGWQQESMLESSYQQCREQKKTVVAFSAILFAFRVFVCLRQRFTRELCRRALQEQPPEETMMRGGEQHTCLIPLETPCIHLQYDLRYAAVFRRP